MSGTLIVSIWNSYSSATLSDAEKALVRGYCGYPPIGNANVGFETWRFFTAYQLMEFKMNNMGPAEYQEVRGRVTEIQILDQAIPAAGSNLDTDQASVWVHNKQEVQDRTALFRQRCLMLCRAVGIPPGPNLGSNGNTIKLVV